MTEYQAGQLILAEADRFNRLMKILQSEAGAKQFDKFLATEEARERAQFVSASKGSAVIDGSIYKAAYEKFGIRNKEEFVESLQVLAPQEIVHVLPRLIDKVVAHCARYHNHQELLGDHETLAVLANNTNLSYFSTRAFNGIFYLAEAGWDVATKEISQLTKQDFKQALSFEKIGPTLIAEFVVLKGLRDHVKVLMESPDVHPLGARILTNAADSRPQMP